MGKDFVRSGFYGLILGMLAFNAQADLYEDGLLAYAVGDYTKAGQLFIKAANTGNNGAEHMLMRLYSEGKLDTKQPDEKTLEWALKAAEKGVVLAQFALAEIYAKKQDNAKAALPWYHKAAEQGHPQAYYELGAILEKGANNVRVDTKESTHMYSIAATEFDVFAQKGDAEAQFKLANMYRRAQGVEQDIEKVVKWMERSALQGHALAQLNLGRLYVLGEDLPRNIQLATHWLSAAAAQGVPEATGILSKLHDNGDIDAKFALLL